MLLNIFHLPQVRETDWDYDGKIDEFFFKMILALPQNINILFVDLLIPINYRLHVSIQTNIVLILIKNLLT